MKEKRAIVFWFYTIICSIFLWRIHIEGKDNKLSSSNKNLYLEIKTRGTRKQHRSFQQKAFCCSCCRWWCYRVQRSYELITLLTHCWEPIASLLAYTKPLMFGKIGSILYFTFILKLWGNSKPNAFLALPLFYMVCYEMK